MRSDRTGVARETAVTLGIAAAEDIEAFRSLFLERCALEAAGDGVERQDAIRREMARLAPAVQRHLEALGGALVAVEDPSAVGRAQRQPLPLTYIAAFGAREDYQPHAEGLAATLETVASRFRFGEGGEERLRRRRRSHTSRRERQVRRAALWALIATGVLAFYAVGLRAFGDWGAEGAPGSQPVVDTAVPAKSGR